MSYSLPTAAPKVDLKHPSVTRVHDYLLGGTAHWAIDRAFGKRLLHRFEQFRDITRANRTFNNRVVRHLTRHGVRQFIDIGPGVLSKDNTHEVADEIDTNSRVVYALNEPVALAHAEVLLDEEGDPDRHAVIDMDLRDADELWETVQSTGLINRNEPVAVLMFSVLHLLQRDQDGADESVRSVARYRELLPTESYLGISHVTHDGVPDESAAGMLQVKYLCDEFCSYRVSCRSRRTIDSLLGDFKLMDPGMVWVPQWHPEESPCVEEPQFATPSQSVVWAGVGQKIT